MSDSERAKLDHYRDFIALLGVSELTDSEFDQFIELIGREKETKQT